MRILFAACACAVLVLGALALFSNDRPAALPTSDSLERAAGAEGAAEDPAAFSTSEDANARVRSVLSRIRTSEPRRLAVGSVSDDAPPRAPVAGAIVTLVANLEPELDRSRFEDLATARTDADGAFRFDIPQHLAGTPESSLGFVVRVRSPDHLDAAEHYYPSRLVDGEVRFEVRLRRGRSLRARILAPDGSPTPDAVVSRADGPTHVADARGEVEIELDDSDPRQPDEIEFVASHPRFGRSRPVRAAVSGATSIDLGDVMLTIVARPIEGRVTLEDGSPVADLPLLLTRVDPEDDVEAADEAPEEAPDEVPLGLVTSTEVITDASGRFVAMNLLDGAYALRIDWRQTGLHADELNAVIAARCPAITSDRAAHLILPFHLVEPSVVDDAGAEFRLAEVNLFAWRSEIVPEVDGAALGQPSLELTEADLISLSDFAGDRRRYFVPRECHVRVDAFRHAHSAEAWQRRLTGPTGHHRIELRMTRLPPSSRVDLEIVDDLGRPVREFLWRTGRPVGDLRIPHRDDRRDQTQPIQLPPGRWSLELSPGRAPHIATPREFLDEVVTLDVPDTSEPTKLRVVARRCARLKFVLQRRDSISADLSLTFAPEFEPIDPVDKVEFTTMQVHRVADDRWRWGIGTIAPDAAHEVHMFDSIPPGRYRLTAELRASSKNPGVLTRYAPIEQVVDLSVGENSISIDLTPVQVLVK